MLGVGDTTVVVGGRLDEGGRSGVALSTGFWLDEDQRWAVQTTWWYAGDPSDELNDSWGFPRAPVFSRPFFNVGSGLEAAQLVAYPNVVAGAVRVES